MESFANDLKYRVFTRQETSTQRLIDQYATYNRMITDVTVYKNSDAAKPNADTKGQPPPDRDAARAMNQAIPTIKIIEEKGP